MGIFGINNNIRSFHELEIKEDKDKSETDYSLDGKEPEDGETNPEPDDSGTDYSLDGETDPAPEDGETDPEPDDNGTDYNLDGETDPAPEDGETDPALDDGETDYSLPDDDAADPAPEDGSKTDYSLDGEANPANENPEDGGADPEDGGADPDNIDGQIDTIKDIEDKIFSNLSPEQLAIRDLKLSDDYNELYSTLDKLIQRINNVPKSSNTCKIIEYVASKLSELKELVNFNITINFKAKTYIENLESYNTYLAVLNILNKIVDEI